MIKTKLKRCLDKYKKIVQTGLYTTWYSIVPQLEVECTVEKLWLHLSFKFMSV